ncbi:MAG: hypothetical protein HN712_02160 [Gemmatimonadetes bacterium]|jgi:predicted O-methyltransferase YrrM|nr:hypothetical protein [Gemmatimonadota bacterium]MBT6147469.1 hypothetical protein [Gemmatimonadota bacterium]MBT7859079.1 hypothetical protein [Gemmatimonadota bacterium]
MATEYEAAGARQFTMDWKDSHTRVEPLEQEIAVVDTGLQVLVDAGILPHADYDHDKMLAHRAGVAENFEIPWTAITHRMQRLIWSINSISEPRIMVAIGIFCGNTFISNAGAAVGPGATYTADRLVGLEIRPEEADRARRNVGSIDPAGHAEILGEDGIEWLQRFDGTIDLLYLDADGPKGKGKSIYLEMVQAAEHLLRPGSLVLAHNSVNSVEALTDYLAYMRDPAHFRESVNMIVDDQGLEVSLR